MIKDSRIINARLRIRRDQVIEIPGRKTPVLIKTGETFEGRYSECSFSFYHEGYQTTIILPGKELFFLTWLPAGRLVKTPSKAKKKSKKMAHCIPITQMPACPPIRRVKALVMEQTVELNPLTAFYFDTDISRRYWQCNIGPADAEAILLKSENCDWVKEWRRQYDAAMRNADWNFAKRHMIRNGQITAENTLVMGRDWKEAPAILCEKLIDSLKAAALSLSTTDGPAERFFDAVRGYVFSDEKGLVWAHLDLDARVFRSITEDDRP